MSYPGGELLFSAAAEGDTSKVKRLLDKFNAPINHVSTSDFTPGMTPLIMACACSNPGTALELISRSADVYIKDENGSTALEYAAHNGLSPVLCSLIENSAPINSRNKKGETALYVAAGQDQSDAVLVLIDAGAELETQNVDGFSPLSAAVVCGSKKALKVLLKAGADPNVIERRTQQSPLMIATLNGSLKICRLLLAHGANASFMWDNGYTCLHFASHEGRADICSALVEAGASINCRGPEVATPLCLATVNGHEAVCDYLKQHGADITLADVAAILHGTIEGREEDTAALPFSRRVLDVCLAIVGFLYIYFLHIFSTTRQTVKADGPTKVVEPFKSQLPAALVSAVREGQADVVEEYNRGGRWWRSLIRRSVDTSLACNSFGHTLLHVAAIGGNHHIIDILLDMGALVCCWRALGGNKAAHCKRC